MHTVRVHTHRLTFDANVVRKRFLSWDDGEADREWAGLVALAKHAPGLAPRPIERGLDGNAPVIVMSRVPGEPLGQAPLSPVQANALTTALRRLFAAPVDDGTPERALGPSTMRGMVRTWAGEEYDVDPCRDPTLVGAALTHARDWLAPERPEVDRVADAVLSVGDGNLANVLWDGDACRLVDFEEFGVSDLACEVADVVEHVSSRLGRLVDVDALLDGLDLRADQLARLVEFRRLLAAFWLVMLLPGNRGFERNPAGSVEDQASHVLALLAETG